MRKIKNVVLIKCRNICMIAYLAALFCCPLWLKAQSPNIQLVETKSVSDNTQINHKIRGTVKDTAGEPLAGAVVAVKNLPTTGTVTDADGNYELTIPYGSEMVISLIGYASEVIKVEEGRNLYIVILKENAQSLDEIVVVGYGVQKKKLLTGATIQVKGDDLQRLNTVNPLSALQSQSPGVMITQTSGQPGEGFKVNIRGLGTVGSSSPLYIIDGVAGGNIDALNPSDIETIDVLKDAASAAIYGARAANGVILITTKQAKSGKMSVTYDGYYGLQYMYKMPDMLTAKEWINLQNEKSFNNGIMDYMDEIKGKLPAATWNAIQNGEWEGTNWMKEAYNKAAPIQNHSINIVGGSDQSKLSMGFSYTSQEGILGKPVESQYDRYTARVNTEAVLLRGNGFDIIKIGETLNFMHAKKSGIAVGNYYWNSISDYLDGNPLIPNRNESGGFFDYYDMESLGYSNFTSSNPVALTALTAKGLNESTEYRLQSSAYLEIQPVKSLIFRSQFGYKMSAYAYRSYSDIYRLSPTIMNSVDEVIQRSNHNHGLTWDNTLAYSLNVNEDHKFDAVIGQSIEKTNLGSNMSATGSNSIFPNSFDHAWLSNTNASTLNEIAVSGAPYSKSTLASFFGRVNYNYKEKYLATVVMRTDGSSNFARGHRWGYFPSVSGGWIISNESFMEPTRNWLDFLKIRASWGQNGNADISNFQYLSTIVFNEEDTFFFNETAPSSSATAGVLGNPSVSWETSEQLDLGLDMSFLSSRLGLNFDWYNKKTKDWLVTAPIASVFGVGAPVINGGDVENKGVELAVNWNDKAGDFKYGINVNFAHNKNKVTRIANAEGIIHGNTSVIASGEMYRAQVGYPIGYFYGYKTAGIFQNQEQIDNTEAKYDGVQAGDVIFQDLDNSGTITTDDRTMIGNPHPDFTLGLNLNFSYKGFDLSITSFGAFGQQIATKMPLVYQTTDIFSRWTGEGTSNRYPRLGGHASNLSNFSDLYIEDGDYMKLRNLTVGYDFKNLFPKMPLAQARLYFTAQNLFTITGYSGMDPEIGYGDDKNWVSGIDLGFYPSPRTFMIGVNLKY